MTKRATASSKTAKQTCRCNNCMGIFDEDIIECPECKTDEYLMQPYEDINMTKTAQIQATWYEGKTGNHQGLIYDEHTGENIAVTYKKEYAAKIVKAVNAHESLVEALKMADIILNEKNVNLPKDKRITKQQAIEAIQQALLLNYEGELNETK